MIRKLRRVVTVRHLSADERAELQWWRQFRVKCGAGFPVRVGAKLGGRQFIVSERRTTASGGACAPVPANYEPLRPVPDFPKIEPDPNLL